MPNKGTRSWSAHCGQPASGTRRSAAANASAPVVSASSQATNEAASSGSHRR
jgi:hypothetical protein